MWESLGRTHSKGPLFLPEESIGTRDCMEGGGCCWEEGSLFRGVTTAQSLSWVGGAGSSTHSIWRKSKARGESALKG